GRLAAKGLFVNDKVTRLRALMAEAVPRKSCPPEAMPRRIPAFDWFESNLAPAPIIQSRRARAEREISRITAWYSCTVELERLLDQSQACSISQLDDAALEVVLMHMRRIQDCAQMGLGSPHEPPAS
ncbi:MAG: hypothetical protein ABIP44_02775, partial [Pseudoxanthomonas sp.]